MREYTSTCTLHFPHHIQNSVLYQPLLPLEVLASLVSLLNIICNSSHILHSWYRGLCPACYFVAFSSVRLSVSKRLSSHLDVHVQCSNRRCCISTKQGNSMWWFRSILGVRLGIPLGSHDITWSHHKTLWKKFVTANWVIKIHINYTVTWGISSDMTSCPIGILCQRFRCWI